MSQEWKLVPVEPTDDMIVAFAEAWYSKRQCFDDPDMADAYRDMIAAAPVPPAGGEVLGLPERTTDTTSCSDLMKRIGLYGAVNVWQGGEIWNACLDACMPVVTRLQADLDSERKLRRELGSRVHELKDQAKDLQSEADRMTALLHDRSVHIGALDSELTKARELLNTPHTDDWFEGVRLEAGHQIQRWGADHDAGKEPADWFWLIGYLAQKAMIAQMSGNEEKARHHTISTGAAMLNWFRAIVGDSNTMRPGIDAHQSAPAAKGEGDYLASCETAAKVLKP